MLNSSSLYHHPEIYASVFGDRDEEEIFFYCEFVPEKGNVLSLGCGDGVLEKYLADGKNAHITGIDASEQMINVAHSKVPNGNFHAISFEKTTPSPFKKPFDSVISPLLSMNYLTDEESWGNLMDVLKQIMKPDGILLFDILISAKPEKLQGVTEHGPKHEFRFYDVIRSGDFFNTIMTELIIRDEDRFFSRQAELAVFKPEELSKLFSDGGFGKITWYAPHDLGTESASPPEDARRGVVKIQNNCHDEE